MSSLPVPRSPTTSTGFPSGAAPETCSSMARKLGASPMIGWTGLSAADIGQFNQKRADYANSWHFQLLAPAGSPPSAAYILILNQRLAVHRRRWHGYCNGCRETSQPEDIHHGNF